MSELIVVVLEMLICQEKFLQIKTDLLKVNILDVKFHSKSTENNENYSNAVVDQLLENARSELDADKRALLYQEAEEIIVKEAPWIPTYFTTSHYVVSKKIKKWIEPAMIVPKLRFVEIAE